VNSRTTAEFWRLYRRLPPGDIDYAADILREDARRQAPYAA